MTLTREPYGDAVAAFFAALGRTVKLTVLAFLGFPRIVANTDGRRDFAQQAWLVGIGSLPVATVVFSRSATWGVTTL